MVRIHPLPPLTQNFIDMENTLRIALFVNSYRTNENRQPDYKATKNDRIIIDGKFYDVAAWKKTTTGGKEYLSIQLSETKAPEDMPSGDSK